MKSAATGMSLRGLTKVPASRVRTVSLKADLSILRGRGLSTTEAAEELGMPGRTARQWVEDGEA